MASHIRTRVPLEDVVARHRPDGGTDSVERAVLCAAIIDIGCLVGAGGGGVGRVLAGGPKGSGGLQGGR